MVVEPCLLVAARRTGVLCLRVPPFARKPNQQVGLAPALGCMTQSKSAGLLGSVDGWTALAAVGLVLFVLPEPITSVIGVLVVLVAAVGWLAGRLL